MTCVHCRGYERFSLTLRQPQWLLNDGLKCGPLAASNDQYVAQCTICEGVMPFTDLLRTEPD